MARRPLLKTPITLAVLMISLLLVLIVLWVVLSLFGALRAEGVETVYWTLLPMGTTFILILLMGVIAYLVIAVRTINLNRRQSNFIDSVTHELKSPIASLKLHLQTLVRRKLAPERREDFLRLMLDDVDRLDHLTTQILDAGRIEAGRTIGEIERFRLDELLVECAGAVLREHLVHPDVIEFDVAPCYIFARRAQLHIVFRNLLDNAVKYGGEPLQIRVELVCQEEEEVPIVVRIMDNGPGIPVKLRRRVFKRFVRLGLELERKKKGTGLGLYIVHSLVRRIGGHISIEDPSEGPDWSVTVFKVTLPRHERN